MFAGLSAFPLTPISCDGIDVAGYRRLVGRLADADVDSICALGSTGSYAYLSRQERAQTAEVAVQSADSVPVIVGVGALRTRDVLANVEDAQNCGAAAVLLAPMTYQPLTDDEVYGLYEDVAAELSIPLVVYDNPGTTHVHFTDELLGRIAQLNAVVSIKIPAVSTDPAEAAARVAHLRARIPSTVTIGISGDPSAVDGLRAGCDGWYSVIAGILPEPSLAILRAVAVDLDLALARSAKLDPLWALFARYGSYRVAAAVVEDLGLVSSPTVVPPVRGLDEEGRRAVTAALQALGLRP